MMRERRRQPAEWEMHEACWVAWPSHSELWGEALEPVRRAFVEMCSAIGGAGRREGAAPAERLRICVLDERGESEARHWLAALEGLSFVRLPFGDIWLRDTAPLFVRDENGVSWAACLRFNGWGGKYRLPG
ncbi:MAG: agmatine deiminase family protein, partial [Myxococcota bacterium]